MNLTVSWTLPTTRSDGRALPASEIKHTLIEMQAQGAPGFTALDPIPAPETELVFEDIDPGAYNFRGWIIDTGDRKSLVPAEASIEIETAAPNGPADFTLTLE